MLEYLNQNPGIVLAVLAIAMLVVVALILSAQNRRMRREREKLLAQMRREN